LKAWNFHPASFASSAFGDEAVDFVAVFDELVVASACV
jgi:hypothetical protein